MVDPSAAGVLSGALLLGAAGLQAMWSLGRRQQRDLLQEQRERRRRAEFGIQLDQALRWARARHPRLRAWTGTRPLRVAEVVEESADARSFYLAPEDGRDLPPFESGQYLTFHLPAADPAAPIIRCYSLSDRPRDDYYRVTIRRVPPPAGEPQAPWGRASTYFHHAVRPGTVLHAEAPQGAFFLDPTDGLPVVLAGAGIGVTPLVSMAASLVHARDPREVRFFAGFRNSDQRPLAGELAQLAAASSRLGLDVSFSQPLATDLQGRDYDHRGHVDVDRLRRVLPSNNYRFYLCGPPAMLQDLAPALRRWGVPREHIHYEAFGPATVRGLSEEQGAGAACRVDLARSGRSLAWHGNSGSLLELAEAAGLRWDAGCRAGNCGSCRLRVLAGRVRHRRAPGAELAAGECLACIAVPDGDAVIDA